MSTIHSMQSSMQFGPEWMRAKPAKPHAPSPPPPAASTPAAGASSYSALVSPAPPPPAEKDDSQPFRYSREEMLKIYRDGGGKGGLGLEVERYEGIVREAGGDPVGLREMGDSEKKLFAGSLNSELRRRQSIDYMSPTLSIQTGERPRLPHSTSASGTGSPMREIFGALSMRRRESSDQLTAAAPRKLSLSSTQVPLSPRDAALPSPRTRLGHTPTFDGVLNGGESWVARRRASEAKLVASRDPDHAEGRGTEIREEDEDATLESGGKTKPKEAPQPAPSPNRDPPAAQPKTTGAPQATNGTDLGGPAVPNGPPPGLQDLASVQWSYLDPQGQLQGPFRADLMQKWFDDGYFTADLLMKRTHVDVNWAAVGELAELARRSGSDKLFLSPPAPPAPPGLPRPNDSPGQGFITPVDQNAYNAPLQPAPVRSLRSSTLDAYAGSSSHSNSPSSSFGAGRFGNGSPDSHGFGGRANNQYSTDPSIGGRFGPSESSSSLRRNTFGDPSSLEPSASSRFAGGDVYATNGSYSPSQGPWQASSSNPLASSFDALNGNFGSSSNLAAGLGQASGFGHSTFGDVAPSNYPEFMGSQQLGGASFGPGQQYSHLHANPYAPQSPAAAPNLFGQAAKPTLPQPGAQNSGLSAVPIQSPWGAIPDPSAARRAAPFDSVRPVAVPPTNNGPSPPVQASPWGTAVPAPAPAPLPHEPSPWFAASHGVVNEQNWKEERGHSLTFSNLGQHNQQFTSPPEDATKAPVVVNEAVQSVEPEVPVKPVGAPLPTANKTRTKPLAQPAVQPATIPTIPAAESPSSMPSGPPKAAWSKEEEAKRPKASGVTLSLREIQDAEAKKAEARKTAERDRDRAVRASSSTVPAPEEAQPFTASWGLPTSQAGVRAAPAKDTAGASPTTAGGAPAVWTNATKPNATKKTMKEIQEEEEKRKKLATKETAAAAARRAYAENTSKAPPPQPAPGAAWTTVGAKQPGNPPPAPVRPPIAAVPSSTSTSAPRTNGVAAPRPAPAPAKAPVPRVEDYPVTASHEFVRWLNDSLKGLNNVNVEEIMSMLLSFPLDPDASTVELISDLIYANSTTLDGRRFAAEFVSKRKSDAATRPKGASVAGASAGKPVSIADVVKAQPKPPASSEWGGFKVVNKKKKGGRS
ncbi:hypothetical protein C8R46DRAFT_485816 [Mycena filopes]|nr:hypothetical protein C8R46DRAFT_485816 [Mycena filopes]